MGVMFLNLKRKEIYSSSTFKDFTNYVSRDEAVDKEVTDINEVENMLDYYSRPTASDTVGFDFLGDKSKDDCLKEYERYKPNEIYTGVISLKEFDAKCMGINTKRDWVNLANKFIKKSIMQMNINRTDVVWGGFYHTNTENPHIHFYIYSKTKKNLNLISKKKVMRIRSILANTLLKNLELFQDKDQLKKEQKELIKDYMEEIELDKLLKQNIIQSMLNFELSFEDKTIASILSDASIFMKSSGRLTMNYLEQTSPEAYKRIMVVVDVLLDKYDDKFKDYTEVLNKIGNDYKILYGKNNKVENYENEQIKRLKHEIGNMILKEIKKSGIIKSNFKDTVTKLYYNDYFAFKAAYEFKALTNQFLDRSLLLALNFKTNEIDIRMIEKRAKEHEKEQE